MWQAQTVLFVFLLNTMIFLPMSIAAFDTKLIKTKIGFSIHYNKWTHNAPGLTKWKDCRYYHTVLKTKFDFEPTSLFEPSISLCYEKMSLRYSYLSNNLPGPLYITEYEGDFKGSKGTAIHPLEGTFSRHQLRFSYNFLFIEGFFIRREIDGGYVGFVEEFDPLHSPYLKLSMDGIGLGLNIDHKIANLPFSFISEFSVSPLIKYKYAYQRINAIHIFRIKNDWGYGGAIQIGTALKICDLSIIFHYDPMIYQTYNGDITDVQHGLSLRLEYKF